MDYLYSLYDALVSINVPNDKARAVVDAMERDMATTIATKSDLQLLRQELTSAMSSRQPKTSFRQSGRKSRSCARKLPSFARTWNSCRPASPCASARS